MEGGNNIRTISSNTKQYKSYTEPKYTSNKKVYNTDSITEHNNAKTYKVNSNNSKKKKLFPRSISAKILFDHYDKKNCGRCEGIDNLMKSDKTNLSIFIENNSSQFLKLFGNKRYNRNSPYLFVEDHKYGIDDKIGLVPIPSKPRLIMKSPDERHKLYEMQRKIVMIRRFQYGQKNFSEPNFFRYSEYNDEESLYKIILIQKNLRGFIIRKKVEYIFNFRTLIYELEKILNHLIIRRILRLLINFEPKIKEENDNNNIKENNYITKMKKNKQNVMDELYRNNYVYKNKNLKNEEKKPDNIYINSNDMKKYSKKIVPKERIKTSPSLLIKDIYDIKNTKDKIDKIENNYKNHYNSKKQTLKKEEEKINTEQKGLYIDKIYYSQMVQKIVNFNNIMRNALQKAVFRKKPNEKKSELDLKEEINYRIDIQPEVILKKNINDNIDNEEPKIINNKNFCFKEKGFYIDIARKRIIKKKDDNIKNIKKPLIFTIDKNVDFKYENKNKLKNKKEDDKIIISNQVFLMSKEKYYYITKERKRFIESKEKKLNEVEIKENIPKKELIIDSNERFKYDEKTIQKPEQEDKNKNILINNKIEIKYEGKLIDKLENKEDNKKNLYIENNSNFNYIKIKKDEEKPDSNKDIIKDNNFSINYIGNPSKITDKNKILYSPEKISDFIYEGKKEEKKDELTDKKNDEKNNNKKEEKKEEKNRDKKEDKNDDNNEDKNEDKKDKLKTKIIILDIQPIDKFHFDKIIEDKNKNIVKDNSFHINYINEKQNKENKKELIAQSISNINYFSQALDLKKNNLDIHNNINFTYLKNNKKINNILKMQKKESFAYENKNEEKKLLKEPKLNEEQNNDLNNPQNDKRSDNNEKLKSNKTEDLIIIKNSDFNIIKDNKNNKTVREFNKKDLLVGSKTEITFEGNNLKEIEDKKDEEVNKDLENKLINELYLIQKLDRKICYITKTYIKSIPKEGDNAKAENNIIFNSKDINNNDSFNNGLLITKQRYLKDKNIQKEKIFKKPLFNEFYSYFIEDTSEHENIKLKTKPKKIKLNKEPSKDNINIKEDTINFTSEKSSSIKKQQTNNILTEKEEENSGLIKTIIPAKGSSETFRIKPNHLLKVIKVQKGKATYEQYINVGKIVPKKIKEEDEEFIYIRYKSKTPGKPEKKYIRNNLLKKYNYDDDVNLKEQKWKEEINLKTKLKIEEKEDDNISNSSEDNKINKIEKKEKKLIKVYKFNFKNYCYASKIRKKDKDNEIEIKTINNQFKSLDNDKKDEEKEEKDEKDEKEGKNEKEEEKEEKEEEKQKEKEEKKEEEKYISKEIMRYNIINSNGYYCEKDLIRKNTYNEYLNHFKTPNENKVYQFPILYKTIPNIPNYISKTRIKKIIEIQKEPEKILKEKPINKQSLITKKTVKALISPVLDRSKIKIDKCVITKEKYCHCLPLPNPKYKNEFHLITKQRKKIIQKEPEELELKLPSENNNNCYITKERKFTVQKGILIPSKKISYIKKERKKLIDESVKIPLKDIYYIEKIRKKETLRKIKTIQNVFRAKKNKDKKDENLLFNNKDKNAFIPRFKNYSSLNDENELKDKDNYIFEGYISKRIKRHIYKIYPPEKCYISKQLKIKFINNEKPQQNLSFLSLLEFFIKKNIQEYVFPKLLCDNNDDSNNIENNNKNKILETNYRVDTNHNIIEEEDSNEFSYPKYYKILRRLFNFYKTKKRNDTPEVQELYDEILPDIKNSTTLNDLIIKLNDNPENNDKLIDYQKNEAPKKQINNDILIEEIGEFVKYDKNLSNAAFIKNKLKENPKLKDNKNIINIIKNVDEEYNNLINGKYCYKCGKEILKCKCDDINYIFKETENAEQKEDDEEDDDFDFDMEDEEGFNNKKINYFEYDTNKTKGLTMINKPRLDDYISQPKKVLQICSRNQLKEINKNIKNRKDDKNSSLNLFSNDYQMSKSINSDNNTNQRYTINSNNNNNNNTINSNNENTISGNNKIALSSYTFNK